jgi:hypothetical protein
VRAKDEIGVCEEEQLSARDGEPRIQAAREAEVPPGVEREIRDPPESLGLARVLDDDDFRGLSRRLGVTPEACNRFAGERGRAIADDDERDQEGPPAPLLDCPRP